MNKTFPGFERIYCLSDPLANSPFRGEFLNTDHRVIGQLSRGEVQPEHPIEVTHAIGGSPRDIIWTTSAGALLVSDRVARLLEDSGFTGWTTFPVKLSDRERVPVAGYHGLAITGRCGPVDFTCSMSIEKEYPMG